jgi:hypothetical protein
MSPTTHDNTVSGAEGWIEWSGGECPLADNTRHEVRFRDGSIEADDEPQTWNWSEDGVEGDIIAYRVVQS